MKALILAAGLGTRLRPHTTHTPKPLFSLAGRPLVDIWIHRLARVGCDAVAVNTHHLADRMAEHLHSRSWPVPVVIRHEPEILGTGGAIRDLADFWDDAPFFVVNADVETDLDLAALLADHVRNRVRAGRAATLAVCGEPEFAHVAVAGDGRILGFRREFQPPPGVDVQRRTFTGIQVTDRRVLEWTPSSNPASSIDAYTAMIGAGLDVSAWESPSPLEWSDLGTPERYRAAARLALARSVLERRDVRITPLAGDGSDRLWFRASVGGRSVVLADHGLRSGPAGAGFTEADAFVAIGNHLRDRGVAVPRILAHDRFSGLVAVEDLGDASLQAAVAGADEPTRRRLYGRVLDALFGFFERGTPGFDPAWCWQTPAYDRELVLERECRYFLNAFVRDAVGWDSPGWEELAPEFESLADAIARWGHVGLMHRDCQSRNVMVWRGTPWFIDFQAARLGPLQYDLASLFIDPYVEMPERYREELLEEAVALARDRLDIDPERFRRGYAYCAISRNLQMLGAFAFLSRVKEKPGFAAHIPAAVNGLCRRLEPLSAEFPRLTELARRLENWLEP